MKEMPTALEQCIEGIDTIARIVSTLKEFAHPGSEQRCEINIHKLLKNTILVSKNTWKYCARTETNFSPEVPMITGISGDLSQVFVNLIVNAAHAIEDRQEASPNIPGLILVQTKYVDGNVIVSIGDNGAGIPTEVQSRIFDPFFTTKEIGRGTGQGLTIAHEIIVRRHAGSIDFETAPDEGTTFEVTLPIHG
jgi:signal transduction histidine kinase